MNKLIEDYKAGLQGIYDHVGLEEDWVVCPIDDATDKYWYVERGYVRYADTIKDLENEVVGNYCEDELYTQRHYPKHVYEGADFTLVFCNPNVDGMKWWRLFDNAKNKSNYAATA